MWGLIDGEQIKTSGSGPGTKPEIEDNLISCGKECKFLLGQRVEMTFFRDED